MTNPLQVLQNLEGTYFFRPSHFLGTPGSLTGKKCPCTAAFLLQQPPSLGLNSPKPLIFAGTVLEGGSTLLWPLWLHARDVGTLQFHTLLYYEPDPPGPVMKYRTARVTSSIHVAPSLAVGAKLALSPARLDRHLLWLDVENKHAQVRSRYFTFFPSLTLLFAPLPPFCRRSFPRLSSGRGTDQGVLTLHGRLYAV